MRLRPANVDALLRSLRDPHEHVGIILLMRSLAAIAFNVCHGAADHVAALLRHRDEIQEALVVGSAMRLVNLESYRVQRIEGVHADAALKTGAGELPETALHLVLHDEVFGTLGDVQEAVDAITRIR